MANKKPPGRKTPRAGNTTQSYNTSFGKEGTTRGVNRTTKGGVSAKSHTVSPAAGSGRRVVTDTNLRANWGKPYRQSTTSRMVPALKKARGKRAS
jgi:hypothetical protein